MFWTKIPGEGVIMQPNQTITLKMADQGWSNLHVFNMILCGTKFSIWQGMEFIFIGYLQLAF